MLRHAVFAIAFTLAGASLPVWAGTPAAATTSASSTAAHQKPVQVIKTIANELGQAIDGHQKELKAHKGKLIKIINRIFLPHFDVDYAAILVLGRHARTATPKQRERFAHAFYKSITHRYAEALVNYTRGAVTVLPSRGPLDARRTIVRSKVHLNNGKSISVDYAFHKTPDGSWKVYDVIIAGISYIANYRNQVNVQIQKEGLNGLIHDLETRGSKVLKPAKGNDDADS